MRDKISINRIATLHPKIRQEAADLIDQAEAKFPETVAIRIVQAFRTFAEQDALYALGRTKPGKIVTNAKGGHSNHNYGLSIDFALMYDKDANGSFETLSWSSGEDFDDDKVKDWTEVVNVFKSGGWSWGGDWQKFKDYPHLEKTFGLSIATMLDRYNKKQFIKDPYILI